MFSHIFTSVSDFERAFGFYNALLQSLGNELRFCEREKPWAGWQQAGQGRPLFVICKPFNGESHHAGNGQMVAFAAPTRQHVRTAYDVAIAQGGTPEGEPGLRPHYHPNYFGCYVRDQDGNKIGIACHAEE